MPVSKIMIRVGLLGCCFQPCGLGERLISNDGSWLSGTASIQDLWKGGKEGGRERERKKIRSSSMKMIRIFGEKKQEEKEEGFLVL